MATSTSDLLRQLTEINKPTQGDRTRAATAALAQLAAAFAKHSAPTVGQPGPALDLSQIGLAAQGVFDRARQNRRDQLLLSLQTGPAIQKLQRQENFDKFKAIRLKAMRDNGMTEEEVGLLDAATTPEEYRKSFETLFLESGKADRARLTDARSASNALIKSMSEGENRKSSEEIARLNRDAANARAEARDKILERGQDVRERIAKEQANAREKAARIGAGARIGAAQISAESREAAAATAASATLGAADTRAIASQENALVRAGATKEAARIAASSRVEAAEISSNSRVDAADIAAGSRTAAAKIASIARLEVAAIGAGARLGAADTAAISRENVANINRDARLGAARIAAMSREESAEISAAARIDAAKIRLKEPGATRAAKIQDQMKVLGITRQEATKLVDGILVPKVDPTSGLISLVDKSTGKGKLIDTPLPESSKRTLSSNMTIREAVLGGNIAGVKGGVVAGLGRTLGQLSPKAVNKSAFKARSLVRTEVRGLVRALSNNTRFPVAEQKAIREEIDIEPKLIDSGSALLARMEGVHASLEARAQRASQDSRDISLPFKARQEARQIEMEIRNFMDRLGMDEVVRAKRGPRRVINLDATGQELP